jgi:hypothetical protein
MNVTFTKTVLVRFIQFGHEAYINAAEFDPAQHERVDEAAPAIKAPVAPAAPVAPNAAGHAVHGMNVDAAKAYAASLVSVADIAAAQAAEYAHPRFPGGRTSVLKALDAAHDAALAVAANATVQ